MSNMYFADPLSSSVASAVGVRRRSRFPKPVARQTCSTYSTMRRPRGSSPMWVRKSTPRPSRARPTATLSGLPPTCSPVTVPSRSTMSISASPMTRARCGHRALLLSWRLLPKQGLQRRAGTVAVQRFSAHRYASTNRGCVARSPNTLGVFDERRWILVLRPGQRHQRVRELVLRPRSARPARRRLRRSAPNWRRWPPTAGSGAPVSRFSRITGSSHFGMRSDEPKHSRAMVSRTPGLANRSISVRL